MKDSSIPATSNNVQTLAGHTPNRRRVVSLFAGWNFIRFMEGNEESFPVNPVFYYDCPTFEYNPFCANLTQLENPNFAPFWLPLALSKICTRVLAEALNDYENHGRVLDDEDPEAQEDEDRLKGDGWKAFRSELCNQTDMTMQELVIHARVNGFEAGVDYMTQCIYYETGIHEAIEARQSGRPALRSA